MKHCRCAGGGGGGISQSGMECEGYLQALSHGGGGTEEIAVLVGARAVPRHAFLRQREQLHVALPSPAPAKESGPSAFHA
uniref:Uncharacterized protein n=1 Tax=Oryza sativa subsp. japonica TaxID=39947 RepID=Q6ESI5_ORYSJ|nr:hypothetical protein [Oryza sativa Japonica Group]